MTPSDEAFIRQSLDRGLLSQEVVEECKRMLKTVRETGIEMSFEEFARRKGLLKEEGRTTLGRYTILRKLGEGWRGAVFLASDQALGREVAIKILRSEMSSHPRLLARYRREVRIAGMLDHPNIVPVLDAFSEGDKRCIVMRLMRGGSQAERDRLSLADALRDACAVARGLAYVHSKGIIHRDVKPPRILYDENGQPGLYGFGLAKLEGGERITPPYGAIGTPYFTSPEQARDSRDIDCRSDIYSLGVSLFWALTGRPRRFGGERWHEVLAAAPDHTHSWTEEEKIDIPEQVRVLVERMIAEDPDVRFPDCDELVREMERVLAIVQSSDETVGFLPSPGVIYAGRYRIEDWLGGGGFGLVYRALDEREERPVALKFLRLELAAESHVLERFRREAEAARRVRHPGIVEIVGFQTETPCFIAMEYLEGETLENRIRNLGKLDAQEAAAIAMRVGEALQALHSQKIVHRDLKPSNIMLEKSGRVVLTDFGLAHMPDEPKLTQSGGALGTPLYMSPEQARGEQVDHRSDLFSMGTVLFEMLAGKPPFRGGGLGILRQIAEGPSPRLKDAAPSTPEKLARVVDRLLEHDLSRRYQSAAELASALRSFVG